MSQNIDKSMAYIVNESSGDFQPGDCLYKIITDIHWPPKHWWTFDMPQKHTSETSYACQSTFGSVAVISQLIDGAIDWR